MVDDQHVDKEKIFEAAYAEYGTPIFRFIFFKTSDGALAQDLTAETFLKFWRQCLAGVTIANPRALLFTIARGLIIDTYRKDTLRKVVPIEQVAESFFKVDSDLESEFEIKERLQRIRQSLDAMPQDQREVILLYYMEEVPVDEIAAIVGKTENAVRVYLHRAVKVLREKTQYE